MSSEQSLVIKVHGGDGAVESFVQSDAALARQILDQVQPARLFSNPKIIIAGTYSMTGYVSSRVIRVDFIAPNFNVWDFPAGLNDVVELSESEFRDKAHLSDPARLVKREDEHPPGEYVVAFFDMEMMSGQHFYFAAEILLGLPAERLQRVNFLLSGASMHFRLRDGGVGILNLAGLTRFTLYPGPSNAPADAWPAHHKPEPKPALSGARGGSRDLLRSPF